MLFFKQVSSFGPPAFKDIFKNIFGKGDEVDGVIKYIKCSRSASKKIFDQIDLKKLYNQHSVYIDRQIEDVKKCRKSQGDDKIKCLKDTEQEIMQANSSLLQVLIDNVSNGFVANFIIILKSSCCIFYIHRK